MEDPRLRFTLTVAPSCQVPFSTSVPSIPLPRSNSIPNNAGGTAGKQGAGINGCSKGAGELDRINVEGVATEFDSTTLSGAGGTLVLLWSNDTSLVTESKDGARDGIRVGVATLLSVASERS